LAATTLAHAATARNSRSATALDGLTPSPCRSRLAGDQRNARLPDTPLRWQAISHRFSVSRKNLRGVDHRRILPMQIPQRHAVHFFCGTGMTEKIGLVEGKARVVRHPGVKPQIAC